MKKYHIARRKPGGKAPTEYETRFVDKEGHIRDIFLKTEIIPNTKKSLVSLMDITERKRTAERLQKTHQRLQKTMNATIDTISKIVEVKDPYTSGHQQRVSQLAVSYCPRDETP
ncbi:MAG: hypothetical protein JRI72_17875 [Deltaproteobacteria bacterium]|nr:hypothetical protein [Deltaproteobacteria bacterium]